MPSFLELPAELRLIVYKHLLGGDRMLYSDIKFRNTTYPEHLQLAGVCRLMQKEVTHHFYARSPVQSLPSHTYVNHSKRQTIFKPLYPLMKSEKACVLGDRMSAEWVQVCSEETLKGLHLIQVGLDQLLTGLVEDHMFEIDNASIWYESLVNAVRNEVSFHFFEIDLKSCSFEGPRWPFSLHLNFEQPYLEVCTAAIKEWVDELARETEGGRKSVTRKHLLKLFWPSGYEIMPEESLNLDDVGLP